MAWSVGEKVASMLLQAGVSILVLRHLTPSDLGAWGILTAIAAVALIVVAAGLPREPGAGRVQGGVSVQCTHFGGALPRADAALAGDSPLLRDAFGGRRRARLLPAVADQCAVRDPEHDAHAPDALRFDVQDRLRVVGRERRRGRGIGRERLRPVELRGAARRGDGGPHGADVAVQRLAAYGTPQAGGAAADGALQPEPDGDRSDRDARWR